MSGGETRPAAERQLPPPDALRRRKCRRAYRRRMRRVGELALAVCDDDNEPSFGHGISTEKTTRDWTLGRQRVARGRFGGVRPDNYELRVSKERKTEAKRLSNGGPHLQSFSRSKEGSFFRLDAQPLGRARTESPPARSGLGAASAVPTPEAPDLDQAGDAGQRLPAISV